MIQLSLFDFSDKDVAESIKILGNIEEPEENYLQRGEKIFSLLRNKKMKVFTPSSVFEKVSRKTYLSKSRYGRYDYLVLCTEKLLRQKWEKACESGELDLFFAEIGVKGAKVKILDMHCEASNLINHMTRKQKFEGAVEIQIPGDENELYYAPMGKQKLTRKQHGSSWHFTGSSNWYNTIDVPKRFQRAYLYNELRERVKSELDGLNDEQLNDNRILEFLRKDVLNLFKKHTVEGGLIEFRKPVLDEVFVTNFIKKYGCPVCVGKTSGIDYHEIGSLWLLSDAQYNSYIKGGYSLIVDLFDLLFSVYQEDKQSDAFNKNLATEYARVYETKKAIPQKTISAMEKSSFNNYFGYVEFDAECDLKKIVEIEKEFKALQNAVFNQKGKKEDVSLRFRKLGHYKAAGLYFPSLKCICVDVRYPSSMAHEYGHMLDYEAGNISRGVKFSKVRFKYAELFEKAIGDMSSDDSTRIKLEGKTKYNKNYYLEPTEIFARSLESYLVEILKVDNSLVKPNEGSIAYPNDNEYLSMVADFFDEFIGGQIHAAKEAASI